MAKLLLVDDDPLVRRMISIRLSRAGHEVDEVENGKQGLEAALSQRYALVLMDMHMPVMDGHEAARQLREKGYDGVIVAVTASAMHSDTENALAAGCDHFIAKPIGENFEDKVQQILDSDPSFD